MSDLNKEQTQFGHRTVAEGEKSALVRGVFDSVAENYDVMNDLMSLGIHRLWKDRLVRQIRPRGGQKFLDVAGGTGDIAFRLYDKIGKSGRNRDIYKNGDITVCDYNEEMLRQGRARSIDRGTMNAFDWITGNAESLPFPDYHFDVYTISFGLRNVPRIDTALTEAYRVLKPGGRFYCLEFSHVDNPQLHKGYRLFSKSVIPRLGQMIAKDRDSYQYLIDSIEQFPGQNELAARISHAGFSRVRYQNLSFGIAAIHQGMKAGTKNG